ncbi:MAG TPA: polysaccharide biosynthesis tyrosine autokinase [Cyclobacteriaceae bacterium]|nr:polysaccharide biosynthesis tyrosine autokinase [Cyclobacteriaceae bacterium]
MRNRYAVRIYPVTASVIIKEREEANGGDLLYKNSLLNPYRNYLNEPYIIRSYPMIQSVIEDLNFEVAFYKEGKIKTSEIYALPVKVRLLVRNGSYGASLIFKALDEKKYSVRNDDDKFANEKTFAFNDSINYGGHHFVVLKDSGRSIKNIKNIPLKLTFLDPLGLAGSYVSGLRVDWAEEGSGVLNLTVTGSNPEKEIDFMNGLITNYQQYNLDRKNQVADRTILFIKEQLKEISDSLKIFEGKLQEFKINNSSEQLNDETKRLFDKLSPLEAQKMELIIRANYFDYLVKYIGSGKNLDLVILPSSVGVDDAVLANLVNKLIDIQLEMRLFISKGLSENPAVQSGMKRLSEIKDNLQESVKSLRVTDNFRSDLLNKQIKELEKQIDQLPSTQRQFVSIQRNYSLLEGLYVFLMQKMSEAGISKAANVSDIAIVNPPMQGGAITPNIRQNYLFGWVLGLLLPIGGFVLLELLNQRIQSKEDIEKITNIPFIGGVGHHESKDNLAVSLKPKSAVAESFRAIRSNLNYFTGNQIKRVFMVSSSISGEGKTFSTINLATVFAMSGRKTLIIGADMRRPKIYSDFELDNLRGLSGYLSRLNMLDEVIQRTPIENLDLISGGPVPPNPSELLLTERFEILIKEALANYDYIVVDTPPLALVTDAFILAKYADHIVFITRQNFTPKAFLKDVHELYNSGKLKNISILLNDIYKSGLGYGYGYGYNYGYGYGKPRSGESYYE